MSTVTDVPVCDRIIDAVMNRCRDVNKAREVHRPTAQDTDFTPGHMQIVVIGDNPQRVTELDCMGNPPGNGWSMPVHLHLNVEISEHDLTPVQTALSVFWADCVKAMTSPLASWHTWGGLAINSQIGNPEQVINGQFLSIRCVLTVFYRTDENNPYRVR